MNRPLERERDATHGPDSFPLTPCNAGVQVSGKDTRRVPVIMSQGVVRAVTRCKVSAYVLDGMKYFGLLYESCPLIIEGKQQSCVGLTVVSVNDLGERRHAHERSNKRTKSGDSAVRLRRHVTGATPRFTPLVHAQETPQPQRPEHIV